MIKDVPLHLFWEMWVIQAYTKKIIVHRGTQSFIQSFGVIAQSLQDRS